MENTLVQKKSQLNREKIGKIQKKSKLNSEKIEKKARENEIFITSCTRKTTN